MLDGFFQVDIRDEACHLPAAERERVHGHVLRFIPFGLEAQDVGLGRTVFHIEEPCRRPVGYLVVWGVAHGVEGDVMLVHKFHFHIVNALARDGIEHAAVDDLPHGVETGKGQEDGRKGRKEVEENFSNVMADLGLLIMVSTTFCY